MNQAVEVVASKVLEALENEDNVEVMHLKLKLEVSASRLFLALGWLLREGSIHLEPTEYGYKIHLVKASQTAASLSN